MAALAMTTLPVAAAAVPLGTEGEDDGVVAREAAPAGVFSAFGVHVRPVTGEAWLGRRDCVDDAFVANANGTEGAAAPMGQIGCPNWVALDDFEDVDYVDGGIGITMCRLDSDNPGGRTFGGGVSVDLGFISFNIHFGGDRGDMCRYEGCNLTISEAVANHSVRT